MTTEQFFQQAAKHLKEVYCLDPGDIDLDMSVAAEGVKNKVDPVKYIDKTAQKYGLTKRSDMSFSKAEFIIKPFKDRIK